MHVGREQVSKGDWLGKHAVCQWPLVRDNCWKQKEKAPEPWETNSICLPPPSVRRILPLALDAFVFSLLTSIHFPHKHRWQAKIKQGFHATAGFANTRRGIDGTHMAINAPSNKKWIQLCQQKGFYSVNVQTFRCTNLSLLLPGGLLENMFLCLFGVLQIGNHCWECWQKCYFWAQYGYLNLSAIGDEGFAL